MKITKIEKRKNTWKNTCKNTKKSIQQCVKQNKRKQWVEKSWSRCGNHINPWSFSVSIFIHFLQPFFVIFLVLFKYFSISFFSIFCLIIVKVLLMITVLTVFMGDADDHNNNDKQERTVGFI